MQTEQEEQRKANLEVTQTKAQEELDRLKEEVVKRNEEMRTAIDDMPGTWDYIGLAITDAVASGIKSFAQAAPTLIMSSMGPAGAVAAASGGVLGSTTNEDDDEDGTGGGYTNNVPPENIEENATLSKCLL